MLPGQSNLKHPAAFLSPEGPSTWFREDVTSEILNVGIAIINLPFWDGLHHLFMVLLGVVYYTLII